MYLDIHPDNPNERNIAKAVDILRKGGVVIYPTDTIYGIGCDITQTAAIERIAKIKNINIKKAQFSFICSDLSHLADYAKSVDTPTFRLLKALLPGPYTFILEASKQVPKLLKTKKDTVGIRVPKNKVCHELVTRLGNPLISASLPMDTDVEYYTDPEVMYEIFNKQIDAVINSGVGGITPSTIVDCTQSPPELVRLGAGKWSY